MKKIKSYTGIWNVEKVLYAINDFNLPFPVTFTQITWFVITEFLIILFGDIPPLCLYGTYQTGNEQGTSRCYQLCGGVRVVRFFYCLRSRLHQEDK